MKLIIFLENKSSQIFYQFIIYKSIANIFLKRCSNTKNVFRDSNERSKNLTSRVVTSVRPIRPDFEFSSGVWLRHPRIQRESEPSFFPDRLSLSLSLSVKIAQCPGMRSERCSIHNGGRRGNEKNPTPDGGGLPAPWSHRFTVHLVRAFVRHLSYNLLRCCYITIHDTRDTRPHFVGTELSSLLLEGLPRKFLFRSHS